MKKKPTSKAPVIKVFKSLAHRWWWRLRGRNGQIVATSHEPFASRRNAIRAAKRMVELVRDAVIRVEDLPKRPGRKVEVDGR